MFLMESSHILSGYYYFLHFVNKGAKVQKGELLAQDHRARHDGIESSAALFAWEPVLYTLLLPFVQKHHPKVPKALGSE